MSLESMGKKRWSTPVEVTRVRVDEPASLGAVSTRALPPEQAERVQRRIKELVLDRGSEQRVADYTGISQQNVGKIKNGSINPGYLSALRIAQADRVPVDVLLLSPPELYQAVIARRWPDYVVAAVCHLASQIPRARSYSVDDWIATLHETERVLRPLVTTSMVTRKPPHSR